jgi:hypothetical protein
MARRLMPALGRSARVALPPLWRAARQFFHEATGALFALFAVYGATAAWRQWKHRPVAWLIGFAVVYAVVMAGFACGAFCRARRIRG